MSLKWITKTAKFGIGILLLLFFAMPVQANYVPIINWLDTNANEIKYRTDVKQFSEGLSVMQKDNGRYGYIDTSGKEVIEFVYEIAYNFQDGMAVVKRNDKWGYIDPTGREIMMFSKQDGDYLLSFSEGLAAIRKAGKWGYIDKRGAEVIKSEFTDAREFHEGLAAVKRSSSWGYIDRTGKEVIMMQFAEARDFSEGLAAVKIRDKWGYTNTYGQIVGEVAYGEVKNFKNGLAAVKKGDKWGYIDKTGKVVIDFQYDGAKDFSENLMAVKKLNKWGYIDRNGNVKIDFLYDSAESHQEGMALVGKDHKVGFINTAGQEKIKIQYDKAGSFNQNIAFVSQSSKWGLLKKTEDISAPTYAMARYSNTPVEFNGRVVKGLEAYTINDTSYVKLRDIAKLASGTKKQFSVTWDKNKSLIVLNSGRDYIDNGQELTGGDGSDKTAVLSDAVLELNGHEIRHLTAYAIGNSNYFKLRELGDQLGFSVEWDAVRKIIVLKMQ